jgi:predicted TIM-barrel fold metal-dependent hydrolase
MPAPQLGAIDIVVNLRTPKEFSGGAVSSDSSFQDKVRQSSSIRQGVEVEEYIAMMDEAGISRSILCAVRCGDLRVKGSTELKYERVYDVCKQYPDRFSGAAGVDPTRGMQGLRDLEQAVKEYGFVAAHWYPHWFAMPPDAAQIYPYYAKCCELDIPIMMQVGQNLIYQKDRRLPSVAKPILLDQVAIDFPELKIIGIHLGTPWVDEMISMCWKHDNVFMAGDAYAPKYWPPQAVRYADSYGQDKFMFGTDWPVVDPRRAMKEVDEHKFRPAPKAKILRNNAIKVFKLKDQPIAVETAKAAE